MKVTPDPLKRNQPAGVSREQVQRLLGSLEMLAEHRLSRISAVDLAVNVSRQHVKALKVLERSGPLVMSAFAAHMDIPLSTATHVIDQLVAKDFASRQRLESDRRIVEVNLAQQGKRCLKVFMAHRFSVIHDILACLSSGERETLVDLMDKACRAASRLGDAGGCKEE